MCDDEEPLAIPAQHTTPHLVGAIAGDLALETAFDGAEGDTEGTFEGSASGRIEDEASLFILCDLAQTGAD